MNDREAGHGLTGADLIALLGPEAGAVVATALTDPAVDTVSMDGGNVWISGRTSSGRTDMLRRLLPQPKKVARGE